MKRLVWRIGDEALLRLTLAFLLVALAIGYFAPNIFISVPPGHTGVLWSRFFGGTVTDQVFSEGTHVFLPWDHVTLYDVREQRLTQEIDSVTNDGLHVLITLDVRYHPIPSQLGVLQRNLGPDYVRTLVAPNVSSFLRQQVARFSAEEVYSSQRTYIERVVLDFMRLNRTVIARPVADGLRFMSYDAVFINGIVLPAFIQQAIERKMAQQEAVVEWSFRVQRERLESQRREIEAQGTRNVLATLGERLSDTYVRLRYVEMLGTLAEGNATKLIVTAPGAGGPGLVVGADMPGAAALPESAGSPARPALSTPLRLPEPKASPLAPVPPGATAPATAPDTSHPPSLLRQQP